MKYKLDPNALKLQALTVSLRNRTNTQSRINQEHTFKNTGSDLQQVGDLLAGLLSHPL